MYKCNETNRYKTNRNKTKRNGSKHSEPEQNEANRNNATNKIKSKRKRMNHPHVAVEVMAAEQRTGLAGIGDKASCLVVALPEVHGDV